MPIARQHTNIDGLRIAWSSRNVPDAPAAPTIAFLHGLGSSSRELLYLANGSGLRDHALLFVDLPGYGDSAKPDDWSYEIEAQAGVVSALLRQVSPAPVTLVGHSMGGSIAIVTATSHPGSVERLIVVEPNLDPGAGALSGHIARQSEDRFVGRGYAALLYQTGREAERGDIVASRFLVTLRQASPVALHRSAVSLRAERSPTFREQIEALEIPRATITGANTPPDDPPLADPAITHELIDNAGHVMMVENPEGFAATVRRAIGEA